MSSQYVCVRNFVSRDQLILNVLKRKSGENKNLTVICKVHTPTITNNNYY